MKFAAFPSCRWLILVSLVSLSGCGGCQPGAGDKLTREELERRAREQRESLVMSELLSLPTDTDRKTLTAKPGHWLETRQQFKSNREDLQVVAVGSVAHGSELTTIPGTNVVNEYTRRTSLPKGQTKSVELQYFVPYTGKQDDPFDFVSNTSNKLNFRTELLNWPLMTPILQAPETKPANELKEHEYQLAVLSPQTLGYEFLSSLDAVFWRGDELMAEVRTRSYVVSLVKPADNQYAFPHSMLTMTAVAAVVWDDVSVDHLSSNQQQALIDWIHWGGQLIISGPSSWSRLQNSFLSPFLPSDSAESSELATSDFAELSQTWVTSDRLAPGQREPLTIVGPAVAGLKFNLNGRGSWLPGSGQLVAEASVGRGRIVVTAFPLREPRIYRWKYFSSFLSTGLLRRPPRTITRNNETRALEQVWTADLAGRERDPRLHSNFRILSRDLPLSDGNYSSLGPVPDVDDAAATLPDAPPAIPPGAPPPAPVNLEFNSPASGQEWAAEASRWGGGGAAWNDYSGLSYQALTALKSAAGIELPSRRTILLLLAGYLACLVPLNWIVFRIIGRLEFAWLAAPVLAVVGVAVVTRVARLDIGFARRTTEISLLELQGDHPRGHLTQYIALYTSLSTNYAVDFPENGSVALPLGDISRSLRRAGSEIRNLRTNYGRSAGVTLEPLTVYSNSTEMLHAEQMVQLPGGLLLGKNSTGQAAVKNDTNLSLKAALVLRCPAHQVIEACWLGDIAAGAAAELNFQAESNRQVWQHWNSSPETQAAFPSAAALEQVDSLWIGGVLHELVSKTPLVPGQTRLVAYTDDRPGQLNLTPSEDQFDGRCVVVAHLTSPHAADVKPDEVILSRPISGELEPLNAPADDPADTDSETETPAQVEPSADLQQ